MKKCPNCGTVNNDNAKFCVNCGTNLSQINKQPKHTQSELSNSSKELYNQNTKLDNPSNQQLTVKPNLGKDIHNLVSDIKEKSNDNSRINPLIVLLVVIVIFLIIAVIELCICAGNLSDMDDVVNDHNNDQNQSYIIRRHQHQLPKLYVHHNDNKTPKANA